MNCNFLSAELNKFIVAMSQLPEKSIKSRQELVNLWEKAKLSFSGSSTQLALTERLVDHLITRQFGEPFLDATREIVSNAIDADGRAKRSGNVRISVDKEGLVVEDFGDGMNEENLLDLLVPNLSTNQQGEDSSLVTGRFGQGATAAYAYLLSAPAATYDPDKGKINAFYSVPNGKFYKATFKADGTFKEKVIPSPKILIHTQKKDCDGLEIQIEDRQGKLWLSLTDKGKSQEGTIYRIVSPLFENKEFRNRLKKSLNNTFRFIETPLHLNDQSVNQLSSPSTTTPSLVNYPPMGLDFPFYKTYAFEGGTFSFSPYQEGSERASLVICEKGRFIKQYFPCGDVPKTTAINFSHRLPLSPDRSSFDVNDQATKLLLEKLLITLVEHPELSWKEKTTILNALHPLLEQFKIQFPSISTQEVVFLPDVKEIKAFHVSDAVYLHPSYFSHFPLPSPSYVSNHLEFYFVDSQEPCLFAYANCNKAHHLFINSQLIHKKDPSTTLFNLILLNQWLTIYHPALVFDYFPLWHFLFPQVSLTKRTEESGPMHFDPKTYEEEEGANKPIQQESLEFDKIKTLS